MKMNMKPTLLAASLTTILTAASPAHAASFKGVVTDGKGQPVAGALVTVFNEAGNRKETVYTSKDGRYAIRTTFTGKLALRSRAHLFEDVRLDVQADDDTPRVQDFQMQPFANAEALSASLTASAHVGEVKWPDADSKAAFISQCNYCHQIGNALTRTPKTVSAWETIIERMEGYGVLLTRTESHAIAQQLHEDLNGQPVASMQKYDSTDELSRAKIMEWHVGDELSFIHDADVGQDGRLYGTDEGHDIVWILDRTTGEIREAHQPDIGLPQGGNFAAMQLPIGVFTGQHGPHSLAQGKDGRFWLTNSLSSTLMSFDPVTLEFKIYPINEHALYPHTVRIDQEGIVWFTVAVSNKVGRFDPRTETMTMIQLPSGGIGRWIAEAVTPVALKFFGAFWPKENLPLKVSPHRWTQGRNLVNLPYGIDVNPVDGSIWYAKLISNKIGRIDPETLAIEEYDSPMSGPRRPRFDKNGILWIPAFDESALMRFDPVSKQFETIKLPLLAANEYETPYALNVHPDTGEVWITSNMSDRVLRYNPVSKTFIAYPSPTRVTWLRDMVFTQEGHVCSSSSNLPAYGIEDKRNAFYCIDPTGGEADRKALGID